MSKPKDFLTEDQIIKIGNSGLYMFKYGNKKYTKEELKKWIKSRSQYQFWSRCEYEFLIAKWPFGGWQLTEDMEKFIATNPNLKDHKTNIDMCNIITKDMDIIDVHEQIMMNIDIVTDILYDEFLKEDAN